MTGNRNSATELSVKIVAMETATSSFSAWTTGAIAAMALPPQIAVPKETSVAVDPRILSARPRRKPATRVQVIPTKV